MASNEQQNLPRNHRDLAGWAGLASTYGQLKRQFAGAIPSLDGVTLGRFLYEPSRVVLMVPINCIAPVAAADSSVPRQDTVDLRLDFGFCDVIKVDSNFFAATARFDRVNIEVMPNKFAMFDAHRHELVSFNWQVFHAHLLTDRIAANSTSVMDFETDRKPIDRM